MKTKKITKLGQSRNYGILRFKNTGYENSPVKRYGQPFDVIEADKIMTNMRQGKGLKARNILKKYYENNTRDYNNEFYNNSLDVSQLLYEQKYGKPVNLPFVNKNTLMNLTLNEIQTYLSNNERKLLNKIVESVLRNQKKKVKKLYKSKKINRNNFNEIMSKIK